LLRQPFPPLLLAQPLLVVGVLPPALLPALPEAEADARQDDDDDGNDDDDDEPGPKSLPRAACEAVGRDFNSSVMCHGMQWSCGS
jgi:hypothetical protein